MFAKRLWKAFPGDERDFYERYPPVKTDHGPYVPFIKAGEERPYGAQISAAAFGPDGTREIFLTTEGIIYIEKRGVTTMMRGGPEGDAGMLAYATGPG